MQRKKVIYLTGPITGVDRYWLPFEKANDDLSGKGYIVLNPATLPPALNALQYMKVCSGMIDAADAMLVLPDWERCANTLLDLSTAKKAGKPVYYSIEELIQEVKP